MESIYYPIYNSVLRVFLAMMIWLTLKKRKKKNTPVLIIWQTAKGILAYINSP